MMRTSPPGRRLIKTFENCVLKAYPDPKSKGEPYTCGWGETEGVTADTCWSQAEADRRFEESLAKREAMVRRYVTHELTQGQFDAFVSLFYNVGEGRAKTKTDPGKDGIARLKSGMPSTLLRKFNAGDIGGCENEWVKWISPGSNVSTGLLNRRHAELALFRGETPE